MHYSLILIDSLSGNFMQMIDNISGNFMQIFIALYRFVGDDESEVMCFNSYTSKLPPLYYDGAQLPYTDSFKYLGMVCDRHINLNTAADAALRRS